jgi:hypothetical protein
MYLVNLLCLLRISQNVIQCPEIEVVKILIVEGLEFEIKKKTVYLHFFRGSNFFLT